eukprot:3066891-Heterocapsa_arctica.AAC.1
MRSRSGKHRAQGGSTPGPSQRRTAHAVKPPPAPGLPAPWGETCPPDQGVEDYLGPGVHHGIPCRVSSLTQAVLTTNSPPAISEASLVFSEQGPGSRFQSGTPSLPFSMKAKKYMPRKGSPACPLANLESRRTRFGSS